MSMIVTMRNPDVGSPPVVMDVLDGTTTMKPPRLFPPLANGFYRLRVLQLTMSGVVPNLYQYPKYSWSSVALRVTDDGGGTWFDVIFDPGYYSVPMIQAGLTAWMIENNWLLESTYTEPPIKIYYRDSDNRVIIDLDTTLANGTHGVFQIGIKFDVDNFNQVVGFLTTDVMVTDACFPATNEAKLNIQGENMMLTSSFMNSRYYNGVTSSVIAEFPVKDFIMTHDQIQFPAVESGLISPYIMCDVPRSFNGFHVEFVSVETGKSFVFMNAKAILTMEISQKVHPIVYK